MRVYEHSDPDLLGTRSHPWTDSAADPTHRYRDFRAQPSLIRSSLEDFVPWEAFAAIETCYGLLEWINGPQSVLESNDSAFSGPAPHAHEQIPMRLECSGRLMVLFRDLHRNTVRAEMLSLKNEFAGGLSSMDEDFQWGAAAVTTVSVHFRGLPEPPGRQAGQQLMISFWAWGDDVVETMAHLDRTLLNVGSALRGVAQVARRSHG